MFPTIRKKCIICIDNYVATLQQCLAVVLDEACHQNVFKAHCQKRYYDQHSGTVMLKPGDIVLLKMDGYTGRRKTKDRWSNEHYTILCQLGLDILTYEIEVEGAFTHIVHQNRLFLLYPSEGEENCVPLVAVLRIVMKDSPVQSLDYGHLEAGWSPKKFM